MSLYVFIGITILFLYVALILFLILGFYRVGEETYKTNDPINSFSIIVPFRNEEDKIEILIESLTKLEYPYSKFEVIFIDDHSTDSSNELVKTLLKYTNIKSKLVKLDDELFGKKYAIDKGIGESVFDWIVTTDADCIVPPLWLKIFDQNLIESDSLMLAGPIKFQKTEKGFINNFQTSDLAAMIGSTIGGFGLHKPFMCNGANLLYSKQAYNDVNGFEGNYENVSGDDIFLLEKFQKNYPRRVNFVKSEYSIVSTSTEETVKDLLNQRIRWASKSSKYNSKFIKFLGFFIALSNLTLLAMFISLAFTPDLRLLFFILMKLSVDLWIIRISSNFLSQKHNLLHYPAVALSYPFYVLVVAILSQTKNFVWKGRKLEK